MNRLTDKVRTTFNRDGVQVNMTKKRIEVYWMRDPRGVVWFPFSGGPIYHQMAMDEAQWLVNHLEEFRCLLPKQIREWPIVLGELSTSTCPGIFHEVTLAKEPQHV